MRSPSDPTLRFFSVPRRWDEMPGDEWRDFVMMAEDLGLIEWLGNKRAWVVKDGDTTDWLFTDKTMAELDAERRARVRRVERRADSGRR
jgi:hypothetical protein